MILLSKFWLRYCGRPDLGLGFGNRRQRGLFTSDIVRGAPRRLSTPHTTTVAATAKASRCAGAGGRRPNPYPTTEWWWGGAPVGSGSTGVHLWVDTASDQS